MEYKEKHMIEYDCGCKHEIGLDEIGGWRTTGNNNSCGKHI